MDATATPKPGKTVNYACAEGARFSVTYHEFVQDDQHLRLQESEIMLRDNQTLSLYRLRRERSASGVKYVDGLGTALFSKGQQALVMQQGERLYTDCVPDQ